MQTIHKNLLIAKSVYDDGASPLDDIRNITEYCLNKLLSSARSRRQAIRNSKEYWVYYTKGNISRPFISRILIKDPSMFRQAWKELIDGIDNERHLITISPESVTNVIYTVITSFCVCYDLWKPGSRKTPGTYFELVIGSILSELLPAHRRLKHIPIPGSDESVSTDIVFKKGNEDRGLVFPVKITTRERIVQPYAHQRILDSVFGVDSYRSVLLCVSEVQRDEHNDVNEICVPGTIRLFQKYLANLSGLYYLDPPARYLEQDLTDEVRVATIGELLTKDLRGFIQ